MRTPDSVLVLGIGNLLWADEGFGVRCVEAFNARYAPHSSVTVMDGGTQGLYLLPYITEARRLIVFDAIDYGLPPGTLKLVEDGEVPRFMGAKKMSLHQTGFQEVLASADLLGKLPEQMLLIGVQPVELEDYGGSLRTEVLARLDESLSIAVARLLDWGVALEPATAPAQLITNQALGLQDYESGRPSPESAWRMGDERFIPDGER